MQGAAGNEVMNGAAPAVKAPATTPRAVRLPQLVALLAATMLPLAVSPVLPLIDFYNHIARLVVLAGIGNSPVLAANYAPAWAVLPNIGLDVVGVGLLQVVPVALLPHLMAALILLLLFAGTAALNRAITGQTSWPPLLLTVPLLYSWILNWGFANFLAGLGLSLLAGAWWLARRNQPVLRLGVALLLAVAIFFCHALAFGLYGVLIAALEIGHWRAQPGRRWADLATQLGLCAVQAVLPALLFLQSRTVMAAGGITNADESLIRLRAKGALLDRLRELGLQRLEAIFRVAEGPSYPADALWLAVLCGVLLLAVRRRALAFSALAVPAVVAAAILAVVMPPALFGSGYVADRMPLFLALVLVAGLMPGPGAGLGRAPWLVPALAGLVGLRLLTLALQWHGTAADLADFDRVTAALPTGQVMAGAPVGARPHEDMPGRCEMYPPLLLVRRGQAVPLFASRAAQPLEHRGRLAAAREAMAAQHLGPEARDRPELLARAHARAGYAYLLLCEAAAGRPFPATDFPIVAQAGRFRLLRLTPER